MSKYHGKCIGCGIAQPLTRHHFLPVRHYGKGKHNDHIVLLCQECHTELERLIPTHPVLETWKYFAVVAKFLKEKANAT